MRVQKLAWRASDISTGKTLPKSGERNRDTETTSITSSLPEWHADQLVLVLRPLAAWAEVAEVALVTQAQWQEQQQHLWYRWAEQA